MADILSIHQTEPSQSLKNIVAEFVAKTTKRRELDAESKRLGAELGLLSERLVELFAQTGLQNIKTASGQTVYINRQIFAGLVGDEKKAKTALRRAGLGDFIKEGVNAQTLRAWVRDVDEQIPKGLQPYIEIREVFKMSMRSN